MRRKTSKRPGRPEGPLKYLLRVMNDPDATWERRDDAARNILPCCHSKKSEYATRVGKKEQRKERAAVASQGTKWSGRLPGRNGTLAHRGSRLERPAANGSKPRSEV